MQPAKYLWSIPTHVLSNSRSIFFETLLKKDWCFVFLKELCTCDHDKTSLSSYDDVSDFYILIYSLYYTFIILPISKRCRKIRFRYPKRLRIVERLKSVSGINITIWWHLHTENNIQSISFMTEINPSLWIGWRITNYILKV